MRFIAMVGMLVLSSVLSVAQDASVEVGEPTNVYVADARPTPAPGTEQPFRPRGPDADKVRLSLSPRTPMWSVGDGVRTQLTVSIVNPTGRLRRVVVRWGDGEYSQFDFSYERIPRASEKNERISERRDHLYRMCAPQIDIIVELYAVKYSIAWEHGGSRVEETEYPGEVAVKAAELELAGHAFHVTPDDWVRVGSPSINLIVGGCS